MRGVREHCNGENIRFPNPKQSKFLPLDFNYLWTLAKRSFPNPRVVIDNLHAIL